MFNKCMYTCNKYAYPALTLQKYTLLYGLLYSSEFKHIVRSIIAVFLVMPGVRNVAGRV